MALRSGRRRGCSTPAMSCSTKATSTWPSTGRAIRPRVSRTDPGNCPADDPARVAAIPSGKGSPRPGAPLHRSDEGDGRIVAELEHRVEFGRGDTGRDERIAELGK